MMKIAMIKRLSMMNLSKRL